MLAVLGVISYIFYLLFIFIIYMYDECFQVISYIFYLQFPVLPIFTGYALPVSRVLIFLLSFWGVESEDKIDTEFHMIFFFFFFCMCSQTEF